MATHFEASDLKTAGKLLILKKYIPVYLTILKDNWPHADLFYVDTHAGTGKSVVSDEITIPGSPMWAFENETKGGFDSFFLFEKKESHFDTLVDTLSEEFQLDFDVAPVDVEGLDFKVATSDEPYVKAFQVDSNVGVKLLAEELPRESHWFTFVDPGRLEVNQDTLDTLIARGNMDILINFHSTGVKRASASSHSRDSAERYMGTSKLHNGKLTEDEYAELYCERVGESEPDWTVDSTAMIDPHNNSYRFDMVFATIAEEPAMKVMQDIWNKEGFWNEAREFLEEYREGSSQSGIGDFG